MEMWLRLAARAGVAAVNAEQAVYRRHGSNMSCDYRWLQDLKERGKALTSFLEDCGALLPDGAVAQSFLFEQLGREAVQAASAAFNENQLELTQELTRYACLVWPAVTRTTPWIRLKIKQGLGLSGWKLLNSAASLWPAIGPRRRDASTRSQ
jgi:hypothetical protein